jgi:hypothetical protein
VKVSIKDKSLRTEEVMRFGITQSSLCERLLRMPSFRLAAGLSLFCAVLALAAWADAADRGAFPGAGHAPDSQPGWEQFQTQADPSAPQDEPQGGRTARGTPVEKRSEDSFPAERRNVFGEVDMAPSGPQGKLEPFDYSADGKTVTAEGRKAIQGQNTWILWGGGDESFWGWLQENNYGLVDFLVLLDSRKRESRFATAGLINQPGMRAQTDSSHRLHRLLGLYLDEADGDSILLCEPKAGRCAADEGTTPRPGHANEKWRPFEPGDAALYDEVVSLLPSDGVDPAVYGYPSGIVGLRLWPNPDFFGKTADAKAARAYWAEHVVKNNDAYYIDLDVNADPKLVRPFRVSMSCGFCHVGPHPLNPPADPENPKWSNLSSTIGNQYWRAAGIFSNLAKPDNFLYHFLASEQPGTVDTSLISTDQINNPNTIISVFDVPARLQRAMQNSPEKQSPSNLLSPGVEEDVSDVNPRHVPRILLDGGDSIGIFASLSRVYVNIGTFSEQWGRLHNPIIGYKLQAPFSVATLRADSVYWRTTEKYRVPYLISFFTYKSVRTGQSIAAPMRLAEAPGGRQIIESQRPSALQGRRVFLQNCAICHSSKQPPGFAVSFSREWATKQDTNAGSSGELTLPMDFIDWERFKKGPAYKQYVSSILSMAGVPSASRDDFLQDNFLSTEIRIPVTLVGTNSARAVGTNAMKGQMWDNFSSEDYKSLPAVGSVRFYNPYSEVAPDEWGNNDEYQPPGGGPGYYRPPSLISIWATAPYLHNNTLGTYNHDPSVQGRLAAFEDAIDKLLWKSKRMPERNHLPGNLGGSWKDLAGRDPGFIYRTPDATWIFMPGKFIRHLLEGVVGAQAVRLTLWAGYGLVILLGVLAFFGRPRHAGFVLIVIAVLVGTAFAIMRIHRVYWLLWAVPLILVAAAVWFWQKDRQQHWARIALGALCVLSLIGVVKTHEFLNGKLGNLRIGPIPQGTPVNLIMNLNPDAPGNVLVDAVTAMTRGILLVRRDKLEGSAALHAFEKEAGLPLLRASKCPDFVLDRGHWFGEALSEDEKNSLKAFLKTL